MPRERPGLRHDRDTLRMLRERARRRPVSDTLGVYVRARKPEDLVDLALVGARVRAQDGYPVYLPGGDYVAFLGRPDPIAAWVAQDDEGLAGHVALNPSTSVPVTEVIRSAGISGDLGVVSRLLVDPARRRQGLAKLLLGHALRHAESLGLAPVLDVIATSSAAIELYRSQGWIEIDRVGFTFPDGQHVDELVFRGPTPP